MTPSRRIHTALASAADDFGVARQRGLPGTVGIVILVYAALVSLAHIAINTLFVLPDLWVSVFHFGSLVPLVVLMYPLSGGAAGWGARALLAVDLAVVALAIGGSIAVLMLEDALYARGLRFSLAEWIACLVVIAVAVELTRRTTGVLIPALIVVFMSYAVWWGSWTSGIFAFPGLSLETMLFRSVFTSEGMFGSIARISWTYIFMFVLFGAFLVRSGAGDFIIALARAAAGRLTGGPGLVAVAASGLMGSITGSAVANAASTGVITIPMMKKAGFTPRFAAGVEAAASTGGQLMPPIMGAGAFIMVNFTGIAYSAIIAAALIPAVMYFVSVAFFVRIRAKKLGIEPREDRDALPIGAALRLGWPMLLPLIVLVALLVSGFTPTYAAGIAIVTVVVSSWLTRNRMGPLAILGALTDGARTMAPIAILMIAVGLIVNVLTTTGVGNTFSLMISEWAGSSLLIAYVLIALASLVLGLGLPVTASYIVLATISAPTLYGLIVEADLVAALVRGEVTHMAREAILIARPGAEAMLGTAMSPAEARDIVRLLTPELRRTVAEDLLAPALVAGALLSAHMIIFWLSQDSNVTPPVALAAFTSAGIAGERPMPVSFTSWKLAKGLYLIPLLFAYTPILGGSWGEALMIGLVGLAGLYAFAGVFEGHLEGPLTIPQWVMLAVAMVVLLTPHGWWWLDLAGLALLVLTVWLNLPRVGVPARV